VSRDVVPGLRYALKLLRALRSDVELAPESGYREAYLDGLRALEDEIEGVLWDAGEEAEDVSSAFRGSASDSAQRSVVHNRRVRSYPSSSESNLVRMRRRY